MLKKIYNYVRNLRKNLKMIFVRKEIARNCTLEGTSHSFRTGSRVKLADGSTREDVILHDHSELFGTINSYNHGRVVMHEWSKLGPDSVISCVNHIEIGSDTAISFGVTIVDHNFHPTNPSDRRYMRHTPHRSPERSPKYAANAPIIIGENVLLGSGCRICKGVTIGDNAIVAANSVVTKDVPANAIAAGNPAKIVKENIDQITTPVFPLKK